MIWDDISLEWEPNYDEWLSECEAYDEALALDLELTEALVDGRFEFKEQNRLMPLLKDLESGNE